MQQLVIGTEGCQILVLHQNAMEVRKEFELKSVPVCFSIEGCFDLEYRIWVGCRDGRVYQIKSGNVQHNIITIDSKPIAIVRIDKQVFVAGMDNHI